MAVNRPPGDDRRVGAVRNRSQLKTKMQGEEHWTKRKRKGSPGAGQFLDQKQKGKFKGVRKEKKATFLSSPPLS
jgi:hypothetical protein